MRVSSVALVFLSWFASLVPSVGFAAPSVSISSSQRCSTLFGIEDLLVQLLPEVANGESIHASVGVLDELSSLMMASGMETSTSRYALDLIGQIIEQNEGRPTVLGNTANRLGDFKSDEKKLLICVLSGGCKLSHGGALHVAINKPGFKIVSFRSVTGATEKPGWMHASPGSELAAVPRIIVMNGGFDANAISWASNFIHEATHFADFELVSDWIRANQSRQAANRSPDQLYARYVRKGADGQIEIDEGFMRVFLESRAYAGELAGFSSAVPPLEFRKAKIEQRRLAMRDIRSFAPVTESFSKSVGLTEDNVFDVGEKLGRTMLDTIRKK